MSPTIRQPDPISRNVRRAATLLMVSIFISRVIGFLREWILARTVGASNLTDVYYASFTIPDFLNYLMASGALSISFIPILGDCRAAGRTDLGRDLFRALATLVGGVLLILVAIAQWYAYELGAFIAPGFSPEQLLTLSKLLRIILPAQLFFYWGGLAISVQHFEGRFWLPALSPIIYNLLIVLLGVIMHKQYGVEGFSWGVLVGSFLGHGLLQAVGVRLCGYRLTPLLTYSPEIRKGLLKYLTLSLPIMAGLSLVVTDEWITKYLSSSLEPKLLSWLSYARTQMRIPVAIIGQAAGIASFPFLARMWSEKRFTDYGETLITELEKLWALSTVSAVILHSCALPITHFIYGGGRLTPTDIEGIAGALRVYSLGVFFWTVQVVLARGFYASQRTWLPSIIGTALSFLCLPLYTAMARHYSYQGLAWSGTIGISVYSLLLWISLKKHLKKHCPNLVFRPFYLFSAAWLVVVAAVWGVCEATATLPIYRSTPLTGLAHVLTVLIITIPACWILMRTFYRRFTREPLF